MAKIKTNTETRGLLRKTLFPPSFVSCLRYQSFLLEAISKEKHSFRSLFWKGNENWDVDIQLLRSVLICQSHLRIFMELLLYRLCC